MVPPNNNQDAMVKPTDEESVGVERLREMLIRLAETHPHEIDEVDQTKELIRSYFNSTL